MTTEHDRAMRKRSIALARHLTKPEIMEVLVLSTAHLSAREGKTKAADWPVAVLDWEHGFEVYVSDAHINCEIPGHSPEDWPGLLEVSRCARGIGVDWVRFDCDADTMEGLTVYEW